MPHTILGTQDESVNKINKCPAFVKLRVRRTISKKKKKKKYIYIYIYSMLGDTRYDGKFFLLFSL